LRNNAGPRIGRSTYDDLKTALDLDLGGYISRQIPTLRKTHHEASDELLELLAKKGRIRGDFLRRVSNFNLENTEALLTRLFKNAYGRISSTIDATGQISVGTLTFGVMRPTGFPDKTEYPLQKAYEVTNKYYLEARDLLRESTKKGWKEKPKFDSTF